MSLFSNIALLFRHVPFKELSKVSVACLRAKEDLSKCEAQLAIAVEEMRFVTAALSRTEAELDFVTASLSRTEAETIAQLWLNREHTRRRPYQEVDRAAAAHREDLLPC